MAAEDGPEPEPTRLGRGRAEAPVVLVVQVTAPRHLGGNRGGETRQTGMVGAGRGHGVGRRCGAAGLGRRQRSREKRL